MIEWISQPWHWAFSGFMIALIMWMLLFVGERFGISSSYRAFCSASGMGKRISYFNYNWRSQGWLFLFIIGSVLGGAFAINFLQTDSPSLISESTLTYFNQNGLTTPTSPLDFAPKELFGWNAIHDPLAIILMLVGGLLIGFGARYAGGCTSGHAISGLSNFQLPSLVAVIGFFIGGLLITHFFFPFFLSSLASYTTLIIQ